MTYDTLVTTALDALPQFKAEYEKALAAEIVSSDDGVHIIFGFVFVPTLIDLIKMKADVTPWFDFIEVMSLCDDKLVGEVCDFTVLEALCDEFSHADLYPLLGSSTKEDYLLIRRYIPG